MDVAAWAVIEDEGERAAPGHSKGYRNALLELYPPLTSREQRQRLGKRNASGVPGVRGERR